MAVLSDASRAAIAVAFESDLSRKREPLAKGAQDVRGAVNAADDAIEAALAGLMALPQFAGFTESQAKGILVSVATRKFEDLIHG